MPNTGKSGSSARGHGWKGGTWAVAFMTLCMSFCLGTSRDLFASALAYWIRGGFLYEGAGSLAEKLKRVSSDLKCKCRQQKFLALLVPKALWFQKVCVPFSLKSFCGWGGKVWVFLRIRVSFKAFTPSNTGLDKESQFPELGTVFKAAFIKSSSWYFASLAVEIAEKNPNDASKD